MACSFAPHNMQDAVKAIEAYIKNENITTEEILSVIKGPDFPTGGVVINKNELLEGYKTGRGRIKLRAKYHLEERRNKQLVVITEIPFMVKKSKIITDIVSLCEEKKVIGIDDVRDESAKNLELVIEITKGFNPDNVMEILFSKTQLENTFSINHVCLINGEPEVLPFKELIAKYVEFQEEVIERRTKFDLDKLMTRLNIVLGFTIVLKDVDRLIRLIRASKSTADAQKTIITAFGLNEAQAKAITSMSISKLTKAGVLEYIEEEKAIIEKKKYFENILNNKDELKSIVLKELKEISSPFYDSRRTEIKQVDKIIVDTKTKKAQKEKIVEPIKIGITKNYIIKRTTSIGKSKMNRDNFIYFFDTTTKNNLTIFMADGTIHKVPLCDLQDDFSIGANYDLKGDEVANILILPNEEDNNTFLYFLTKNGMLKKTKVNEIINTNRKTTLGMKLKEKDKIVSVLMGKEEDIILFSKKGYTIRLIAKDINATGKRAMGIKGMKVKGDDECTSAAMVKNDAIFVITNKGKSKVVPADDYPTQGTNGVGVLGYKYNKDEFVCTSGSIDKKEKVLIFTNKKLFKVSFDDFPLLRRNAYGNFLTENNEVINATII